MSVQETLNLVERDRDFYSQTGGGLTVGGGEPSFQADFVSELLSSAHDRGIHTAVETCGFSQWSALQRVLEHSDQVLFDIKHLDSARHLEFTGVGNEEILSNARRAAEIAPEFIVRFPLIPGCNSDSEAVRALGRFVRDELPRVHRIEVLPYHSTGESKKQQLHPGYVPQEPRFLAKDEIVQAVELLRSFALEVVVL
jgi:pyruvate formate lyase activating enzyme